MTCEKGGEPPDPSVVKTANCPVAESVSPEMVKSVRRSGALANWRAKREAAEVDLSLSPLLSDDIVRDVRQGLFQAVPLPPGKAHHVHVRCDGCGAKDFGGVLYWKQTGQSHGDDFELCGECYQKSMPPEAGDGGFRDDDGVVVFEHGGAAESVKVKLPPGVPVPSKEMIRRHKAAGHCPYRPWCEDCIRGAANAPSHFARNAEPLMDIPELHSDYGFFRDQKGDKQNTVTILVTRDRKSKGICANVVPKKGVGGGYAVKQYMRDGKKFGIITESSFGPTVSRRWATC